MNVQVGDIIKLENNQFVTVGLKVVEDDQKVVYQSKRLSVMEDKGLQIRLLSSLALLGF